MTATPEVQDVPMVVGPSRQITQQLMVEYTNTLGFRNPIHYDGDLASESEFGGPIASGPFALALIDDLLLKHFPNSWLRTGALKVVYRAPVRPGDTITAQIGVLGLRLAATGSRVELRLSCVTGDGTEVVAGTGSVDVC